MMCVVHTMYPLSRFTCTHTFITFFKILLFFKHNFFLDAFLTVANNNKLKPQTHSKKENNLKQFITIKFLESSNTNQN